MKPRAKLVLVAVPSVAIVLSPLYSSSIGILPNTIVQSRNVGSLTRTATASCGQCHLGAPGQVRVQIAANPVIPAGTSTSIGIIGSATTTSGPFGGFCCDVTAGTFTPGWNTRTSAAGNEITHTSVVGGRRWSFSWNAPTTPGLAELYAVVLAANGDSVPTGDHWAFHGSSPTSVLSTPVRLYSLPVGIRAVGYSCMDGFGNRSVLGAPLSPSVGNAGFKFEAFGLPPASPALFMLNAGPANSGFDLAPMGAPGCVLYSSFRIQLLSASGPGDASRAEGSLVVPAAIPNQPTLRGSRFTAQLGVIDSNTWRSFGFTTTNAIEVTIQ